MRHIDCRMGKYKNTTANGATKPQFSQFSPLFRPPYVNIRRSKKTDHQGPQLLIAGSLQVVPSQSEINEVCASYPLVYNARRLHAYIGNPYNFQMRSVAEHEE